MKRFVDLRVSNLILNNKSVGGKAIDFFKTTIYTNTCFELAYYFFKAEET